MTLAYSLEAGPARAPRTDLCSRLRSQTLAAHGQLEASLDLLGRISDRQAFRDVLERFFGFHVVWERAISAHSDVRAFQEPRSRLPHLRRDLSALGRTTAELDRLARCEAAAGLAPTRADAIGSLYVLEGSTLGGQVISRALAQADWAPSGGLTYFHPYGPRTGEMWRRFRAWADAEVDPRDHGEAARGANASFALLTEWLGP